MFMEGLTVGVVKTRRAEEEVQSFQLLAVVVDDFCGKSLNFNSISRRNYSS